MDKVVYLVNSTPKYYYMLPLHFALLRRYWPECPWRLVLATEVPGHLICQRVAREFGVEILPIAAADAGFLDSRRAALAALALGPSPPTYVLPMQEDFLLEGRPMVEALAGAIRLFSSVESTAVASVRLMPCPGPQRPTGPWSALDPTADTYGFTFQATLWRLEDCLAWYTALCNKLEREWPLATTPAARRIDVEVRANFAENAVGQQFFWEVFKGKQHLAWRREGPWSNAVYRCPWPYRPTAIVKGKLEPWAAELGQREGFPLA